MLNLQEMLVLMGIVTSPNITDAPIIEPDIFVKQQQEEISCMADNIYFEETCKVLWHDYRRTCSVVRR